jgi:hypothetical protein
LDVFTHKPSSTSASPYSHITLSFDTKHLNCYKHAAEWTILIRL